MANNRRKSAKPSPGDCDNLAQRPVHHGEVASALVTNLLDCFKELEARRKFDGEVAAWLKANPLLSEAFRKFQDERLEKA